MNFSQNNEQEVIQDYFKNQLPKDLTFLDIGANDGKTLSNTYALALSAWQGVRIEPDPIPFFKLSCQSFSGLVENFNLAIGLKNESMPFYQSDSHLSKSDSGLLSTLNKSEIDRWKGTQKFEEIEVDVLTWEYFLKTQTSFETFDFISIDAEGMDLDILKQMNLAELKCQLICIEWNAEIRIKHEIDKICRAVGMRKVDQNYENLIYGL